MSPDEINHLTLSELCDLLVSNTTELLDLLNHKGSDPFLVRDKKADVEMIQSLIKKKKSGAHGLTGR